MYRSSNKRRRFMEKIRTAFKGRLITVFVKKVRLPNGFLATYEMIKHPGAALIVPFLSRDKMIMLRQLRPVVGKYIYELPAGTLDKGEKPRACAFREIIEETGYKASKMTAMGYIYPVPGYSTERIFIFKAEGLKKVERVAEEDEIIESVIVTKAEAGKLFRSGKLNDAKTISALTMCGWL